MIRSNTVAREIECPKCEGTGVKRCPKCRGIGYSGKDSPDVCPICNGDGVLKCGDCDGKGRVTV